MEGDILKRNVQIILVLLLLCSLITGCSKTETQTSEPVKQKTIGPLTVEDFSLRNVTVGEALDLVIQKIGNPKNKKQNDEGVLFTYDDIELTFSQQNTVINLTTDNASVTTRRGIHPGSTIAEVKEAYGEGFKMTKYNDLDLYEYNLTSNSNVTYILRFAVNSSSGAVKYIGMRNPIVVEANLNKKDNSPISKFYGTWYMNGPSMAESGHIAITENEIVYIPLHDVDRIPKSTWKRNAYTVSSVNVNPDTGAGYAILKFDDGSMNRFNLHSDNSMTWDKRKYSWKKQSDNTNY